VLLTQLEQRAVDCESALVGPVYIPTIVARRYKPPTNNTLHGNAYVHLGLVKLDPYVILGPGASVPEEN
jgi:hypothetical protein